MPVPRRIHLRVGADDRVEVPAVGHATYIFAPGDVARFVRQYATFSKDDIRTNRNGAAESLGFIGRVMYGENPRTWLRRLNVWAGESRES